MTSPLEALAQTAPATGKPLALNAVDTFLAIDAKGMVTVYSGKVDLGTGVLTALSQIVADELDVPLKSVAVVQGDTALTPDQGKTWGSLSIQIGGVQLRNVAAVARNALLELAGGKLGVKPEASQTASSAAARGTSVLGNLSAASLSRWQSIIRCLQRPRTLKILRWWARLSGVSIFRRR